jgi:hypothetical protein
MSRYLYTNEIESFLMEINNTYKKIYDMKNSIKDADLYINEIKELLKKKCDHNKIIDITSSDERTQYVCSKCQQYL